MFNKQKLYVVGCNINKIWIKVRVRFLEIMIKILYVGWEIKEKYV